MKTGSAHYILISIFYCLLSESQSNARTIEDENVISTLNLLPEEYRLSMDVIPINYDLVLTPNFRENVFECVVKITINATKPSQRTITLLGKGIKIKAWRVERKDLPIVQPTMPLREDVATQKLYFQTSNPLETIYSYLLIIEYTITINDGFEGLFKTNFKEGGIETTVYGSQLSPIYARQLLPCFDEPRFKATFKLTVKNIGNMSVVSNAAGSYRVEEGEEGTKINSIYFEESGIPIPTYAFGIFISELEPVLRGSMKLISRVGTETEKNTILEWTLTIAKSLGEWYDYPLDGISKHFELVAFPDYIPSAMEQLGSIYGREIYMIYDSIRSCALDQQRIILELSNKLARQWIGVRVSLEQWTQVWLRDGVAKLLASHVSSVVMPFLDVSLQFNFDVLQSAMKLESLPMNHPVLPNDIYTPDDIADTLEDELFGMKGAVILRWIESLAGLESFQASMRRIIKEHLNMPLTTSNFLAYMDYNVLSSNISTIFSDWLTQTGYPIVTVTRDNNTIKLQQQEFHLKQSAPPSSKKWHIPVGYVTDASDWESIAPTHILDKNSDELKIELVPDNATFYLLNPQQIGYYRVNYDEDNWYAIKVALKSDINSIHVLNRAQIVDDLFNLAAAGQLTYGFAFDVLEYLEDETEYLVWRSALNGLSQLAMRDPKTDDNPGLFGKYNVWFLDKLYKLLGFEVKSSDNHLTKLLKADMLHWLCKFGQEDCIMEVEQMFTTFKDNGQSIKPDMEQAVLCSAIRNGEDISFVWDKYLKEEFPATQQRYLVSLTCTRDPEHVNVLLARILTTDIRQHDKEMVFKRLISENVENVQVALTFFQKSWNEWNKVIDVAKSIHQLVAGFTTDSQIATLRDLVSTIKRSPDITSKQSSLLDLAIVEAVDNVDWNRKRLVELLDHMNSLDFLKNSATQLVTQSIVWSITVCALIFTF